MQRRTLLARVSFNAAPPPHASSIPPRLDVPKLKHLEQLNAQLNSVFSSSTADCGAVGRCAAVRHHGGDVGGGAAAAASPASRHSAHLPSHS